MKKTLFILFAVLTGLSAWQKPDIELWLAMKGAHGPQPENPSIIMLGDSHTAFVNWRLLEHCENIANFGVGGNNTSQILARLPDVLDKHPELVIVMAGTNDALQNIDPNVSRANLRSIETQLINRKISFAILNPPPLPSHRERIEAIAETASLTVPFSEDDLLADLIHLRRSAYAKWRDAIAPLVQKFCSR